MGVVRDVTVDNLVTAVGNIDTSNLAQDSTLRDVVTAISNISGGNDPVTNTTVNTLGKDTTLQSIAAAISGLGATLGSDKANISGDNIASPATFRQNIGLNIHTETYTGTTNNQGLLTTNILWTGQILAAYATVVSTSVRVFAIGHRPSGGGYIVSKLMSDNGSAVSESQVTLTITLIG